jgi:hypothetical protein
LLVGLGPTIAGGVTAPSHCFDTSSAPFADYTATSLALIGLGAALALIGFIAFTVWRLRDEIGLKALTGESTRSQLGWSDYVILVAAGLVLAGALAAFGLYMIAAGPGSCPS